MSQQAYSHYDVNLDNSTRSRDVLGSTIKAFPERINMCDGGGVQKCLTCMQMEPSKLSGRGAHLQHDET